MKLNLSLQKSAYIMMLGMIVATVIVAIGIRPESVGSDTQAYIHFYNHLLQHKLSLAFQYDYLFEELSRLIARFALPRSYFLGLLAAINFTVIGLIALSLQYYLNHKSGFYRIYLLLMAALFVSPFFWGAQLNVLRHGISLLFLCLYFVLLLERRYRWLSLPFFFLALGFHHTALLYFLVSPLLFLSYRTVFCVTLSLALLYLSHITMKCIQFISLVGPYDVYYKIMNRNISEDYVSGIRWDFSLFTLFIGGLAYLASKYFLPPENQKSYLNLLKIYWILTIPFFLFGFAAFSDRYLLAPWVFASILAAVFLVLIFSEYKISRIWSDLLFFMASMLFIIKTQGFI